LSGETGVEHGYVVAEYSGALRKELGEFVKTVVGSIARGTMVDEQAGFVSLVGGSLGDSLRWELVV